MGVEQKLEQSYNSYLATLPQNLAPGAHEAIISHLQGFCRQLTVESAAAATAAAAAISVPPAPMHEDPPTGTKRDASAVEEEQLPTM